MLFLLFCMVPGQFSVKIQAPENFSATEAYLYSLRGSKDILTDKAQKKDGFWIFKVAKSYSGMMKVYFPVSNSSLSFVAENRDVELSFTAKNDKVDETDYKDPLNSTFFEVQDQLKKREQILPALYQIQTYYRKNSAFGAALQKEILTLDKQSPYDAEQNKFLDFYHKTYTRFLFENSQTPKAGNPEIVRFLNSASGYLETSSLLKPLLMQFLGNTSKSVIDEEVDRLFKTVDVETPRGQIILSELIDIFSVYNIKDLKEKYLKQAQSLKCTIDDRLNVTLASNKNTAVGSKIPNVVFTAPLNTKAKSLHEVKADKKIIVVWSSTCPHCEKELSEVFSRYGVLKSRNIEVVGLSLDTDAKNYMEKARLLPWVNDAELKGWYSSYAEKLNVHATPTFYLVDQNNTILANPEHFSDVLAFLGIK